MQNLTRWKAKLEKITGRIHTLEAQIEGDETELTDLQARQTATNEALDMAQRVAAEVQNNAGARVAGLVSRCLAAIFPDPYGFEIEFVEKRNTTEAVLWFTRDGERFAADAVGGGVVDVAAFALRLASLTLRRPRPRQVLIMDEPFKFVSAQYRPHVRDLLESLADDLGFQFIYVTHIPELTTGNVVEL